MRFKSDLNLSGLPILSRVKRGTDFCSGVSVTFFPTENFPPDLIEFVGCFSPLNSHLTLILEMCEHLRKFADLCGYGI